MITETTTSIDYCHEIQLHRSMVNRIRDLLNRSLLGKPHVIEHVLACLLARGHLLIEDLPGLGKTTLAKALATSIGGRFSRVQCTSDLLPGDITGFSVFNQKTREFEFLPGPIFAEVLLVDEINRTSPRTQSALLEAMAENQVTVENVRYDLAETFFVIATQNPSDHHGTYPLPEAQLDRFAMKLTIGYPHPDHELEMLASAVGPCCAKDTPTIQAVIQPADLHHLQQHVAAIKVSKNVRRYLVDLATVTRQNERCSPGLSPRGVLTWQRVAQAWAFLQERDFVIPDDIQTVADAVLGVRLNTRGDTTDLTQEILRTVKVPVSDE